MIQALSPKPKTAEPKGKAALLLPPILISRQAAARCMGVSLSTLDKLVATAGLPSVWVGERRMFRPADLEAWAARLPPANPPQKNDETVDNTGLGW